MSPTSPKFGSSFRLLGRDQLDEVLDSLENVSDYYFCDGEPIRATVRGKTVTVTRRPLDGGDIKMLVTILGDESQGLFQNLMTEASPRDRSYVTRSTRVRHRVNLTINSAKTSKAVRVVMRRLESEPWPLSRLRLPPGLLDAACSSEPGLTMILGATGSGKTSLLSGVLRYIVESLDNHGHVVTIEDPVEYVYDQVASENFVISQMEVGVGCRNFADGLRAAMRMHPTHILVGEIRDPETAAAAIAAARSGHKVFATMHVSSVAEMFGRWSDFFPPGSELRAMNDLAAVIDFACYQTLEETEKGFMPVQESLSLLNVSRTDFITMVGENLNNLFKVMDGYVKQYGISHFDDRLACNPSMAANVEGEQTVDSSASVELKAPPEPVSDLIKVMDGYVKQYDISHSDDRLACNPSMAANVEGEQTVDSSASMKLEAPPEPVDDAGNDTHDASDRRPTDNERCDVAAVAVVEASESTTTQCDSPLASPEAPIHEEDEAVAGVESPQEPPLAEEKAEANNDPVDSQAAPREMAHDRNMLDSHNIDDRIPSPFFIEKVKQPSMSDGNDFSEIMESAFSGPAWVPRPDDEEEEALPINRQEAAEEHMDRQRYSGHGGFDQRLADIPRET